MAFKSYSQNFTKSYQVVFEKIHFTSPPLWKILSANATEYSHKNPFNFDSIKNSFSVQKVSGIKILFPTFHKKLSSGFWKKNRFTSPPLWKFLSSNVTAKTPKIQLILIQFKIPFECTKSLALGCYSKDFTKNYQVVFEKSSLCFTSHMKISKSKSNNKTLKNPFNFDSIKIPFGYI